MLLIILNYYKNVAHHINVIHYNYKDYDIIHFCFLQEQNEAGWYILSSDKTPPLSPSATIPPRGGGPFIMTSNP